MRERTQPETERGGGAALRVRGVRSGRRGEMERTGVGAGYWPGVFRS